MDEQEAPRLGKEKLNSRDYLWKTLRPAGCVLVLLLGVMAVYLCFTAGRDPIPGYQPPESTEYYAAHPEELLRELEENVFPRVDGVLAAETEAGAVAVTIAQEHFVVTRSALLRYFDESLLTLRQGP